MAPERDQPPACGAIQTWPADQAASQWRRGLQSHDLDDAAMAGMFLRQAIRRKPGQSLMMFTLARLMLLLRLDDMRDGLCGRHHQLFGFFRFFRLAGTA